MEFLAAAQICLEPQPALVQQADNANETLACACRRMIKTAAWIAFAFLTVAMLVVGIAVLVWLAVMMIGQAHARDLGIFSCYSFAGSLLPIYN